MTHPAGLFRLAKIAGIRVVVLVIVIGVVLTDIVVALIQQLELLEIVQTK